MEASADPGTANGSKRTNLLVIGGLLLAVLAAALAFVWMAKQGLERSGAGDYEGGEELFAEDEEPFGVRER